MYEFQIQWHVKTKRWSCNSYLHGKHHELRNFDTLEDLMLYMLETVPPEAT